MSDFPYDLYCDESKVGENPFYFGAIHCSRARANILDREIREFRARTGLTGELKWTKVSKTKLPAYLAFTDIFLEDMYATFVLSEVVKGAYWRKLASSTDSRILHAYFHFIEQAMWASARYAVFLDETSSKQYKFKSFHYALNLPGKKVHTLELVDSHQHNVMQLVDVVLGALTSRAIASPKVALSKHVREKIARNTKYGRPKLITHSWTAPETRRFKPNL